jgi:hypothetical protein
MKGASGHNGVIYRYPSLDEVAQAQADAEDKVGTNASPHRADNLERQAQATLLRAAILIGSPVVVRRYELVNKITVGEMQLYTIKSAVSG